MEHSKEYYMSLLAFLEEACAKGRWNYSYEEGCDISPDYWMAICEFLETHDLARVNNGDIHIRQFPPLVPIIADCKAMIKSIEKAEHDRALSNQEKIENIRYGRKGYKLSRIAIWLSALAIAVEIARGILDLIL